MHTIFPKTAHLLYTQELAPIQQKRHGYILNLYLPINSMMFTNNFTKYFT